MDWYSCNDGYTQGNKNVCDSGNVTVTIYDIYHHHHIINWTCHYWKRPNGYDDSQLSERWGLIYYEEEDDDDDKSKSL